MSMTDAIVQRRPMQWYVGKVIYVTPAYGQQISWPSGYYRVTGANLDLNTWETAYLGDVRPHEPVYVHDGRQDLKAIPSTVVPAAWKWLLWTCVYLVLAVGMLSVSGGDGGAFWPLILLPVALVPFYDWYMAVEPVRGTKTSLAIFGVEGALAMKQRHDRAEMARIDEKINP